MGKRCGCLLAMVLSYFEPIAVDILTRGVLGLTMSINNLEHGKSETVRILKNRHQTKKVRKISITL